MAFVSWRAKENSKQCAECKFNFLTFKVNDKGYIHFMDLDGVVNKVVNTAAKATMISSCKVCSIRKDFVKVYGVEPVEYFTAALEK